MSFTYNQSLVLDRDKVRFLLQDTYAASAELQDEEIDAVHTLSGSDLYKTAYECALVLYRRYSKLVTISADGTSLQYSARAKQWGEVVQTLAETLLGGTENGTTGWAQVVQTVRPVDVVTDYLPVSFYPSPERIQ